jgi:hypothetical protein
MAEAVRKSMAVLFAVWRSHQQGLEMLTSLLSPPTHWGPVTASALAEGVQGAEKALRYGRDIGHTPQYLQAIELLVNAGADLRVDGGALLRTAVRQRQTEVVKTILKVDPGSAIAHGAAALHEGCEPVLAVLLIKAGAPIDEGSGLYEELLVAALKHANDELLDVLLS